MSEISSSVILSLNELELICWRNSIAIVFTLLNGFNYCYLDLIILLIYINHLFAHSEILSSISV